MTYGHVHGKKKKLSNNIDRKVKPPTKKMRNMKNSMLKTKY